MHPRKRSLRPGLLKTWIGLLDFANSWFGLVLFVVFGAVFRSVAHRAGPSGCSRRPGRWQRLSAGRHVHPARDSARQTAALPMEDGDNPDLQPARHGTELPYGAGKNQRSIGWPILFTVVQLRQQSAWMERWRFFAH